MFMCKECHETDHLKYHCTHFAVSQGKCELCNEVKDCFDCTSYKGDPNLSNMVNIYTNKEMNDAVANWCPNGCPEPEQHKFSCAFADQKEYRHDYDTQDAPGEAPEEECG